MFSTINSIFKTQPRMAEHADSRLALNHHDPEYQRRRKNNKHDEENTDHEGTTVSVAALKPFLENFLKTKGNQRESRGDYEGPDRRRLERAQEESPLQNPGVQAELDLNEDKRRKSATAARAAYAYQSMSHSNKRDKILLETTDTASDGPEFELDPKDARAIHEVLDTLKELEQRKIEYVTIYRAETFIESLKNAVTAALNTN